MGGFVSLSHQKTYSTHILHNSRDGSVCLVTRYQEQFIKYRDDILQPPLRLSPHIMEGKLEILGTNPKSGKNSKLLSNIFVHFADFIQY